MEQNVFATPTTALCLRIWRRYKGHQECNGTDLEAGGKCRDACAIHALISMAKID